MSKYVEMLRGYMIGSCIPATLLSMVGTDPLTMYILVGTQIIAAVLMSILAYRKGYKFLGGKE